MKFTMAHLLFRIITLLAVLAGIITPQKSANAQAVTQTEITGPDGSGQFGYGVTILPNGNWVIVDPYYDEGKVLDVGAVYLYDGETNALVSKLTGSTASDNVG